MDEYRRLFEYNRWANLRFLDAADALTAEELERYFASSFPSVLETLAHMLEAEWIWLRRWNGSPPAEAPDDWDLSSVASLREIWDGQWEEQKRFLDGLGPDGPEKRLEYRLLSGTSDAQPLGELMHHVVNHGTYHRGQLTTLLRQLGKTPPSTDYVRYLRELDR